MKPKDITKTLDNYLEWKKPDYAVLLTGGWGTGKTFYIKKYRKRFCWAWVKRPIYVSLYGMREESEIENQIFVKVLFSNAFKSLISLLLISFVGALIAYSIRLLFVLDKDNLTQWIGIAGISLLPILAWFYKTFKTPILNILLSGSNLIFDDFERSEIPIESRFAYINRYVEHLHKHVVIICNDKELKDTISNADNDVQSESDTNGNKQDSETAQKATVCSSFQKIQEKVIGKKIVFEQPPSNVLRTILKNSDLPCLKEIVFNKKLGFDWFISVSTPQTIPVNYRVWKRCCRDFESTFGRVNPTFFNDAKRVKSLIGQFFPIVYCVQIHDFGNGLIFPQDSMDNISSKLYQSNGSLSWINTFFPNFHLDYVLSREIWSAIIFNQHDEPETIESYWKEITCTKSAFYETLNGFYHKTDSEIDLAWNELKDAFEKRTIKDVRTIIQVFVAFLDMISKQCCPTESIVFLADKEDKNVFSPKKVFAWLRLYCQNLHFDIKHTYDFSRSFYYMVYADRLNDNDKGLLKKCLEYMYCKIEHYCRNMLPSETFQSLLNVIKISRDDEALFYKEWNNYNFDSENVFSHQNPTLLLNALLDLPMTEFGVRFHTVLRSMRESTLSKSESYIRFKKEYVKCIQETLSNKTIHLDRSRKQYLRYAVESLTKDLSQDEEKQQQNNVPSTSTDKEPKQ